MLAQPREILLPLGLLGMVAAAAGMVFVTVMGVPTGARTSSFSFSAIVAKPILPETYISEVVCHGSAAFFGGGRKI